MQDLLHNNIGVVGIAPNVRVMPLKALGVFGRGTIYTIIDSIHYAAQMGARIINMSFVFQGVFVPELYSVIAKYPDILFVTGAGNSKSDNDVLPTSPASFTIDWTINGVFYPALPNVLSVGAISGGALANFSSYGHNSVSVVAPGTNLLSTRFRIGGGGNPLPGFGYFLGTSYAAAIASGSAALLLSAKDTLTPKEVIFLLKENVTKFPVLENKIASGGAINLKNTMRAIPIVYQDFFIPKLREDIKNIFETLPLISGNIKWKDTSSHWAKHEIEALSMAGIIRGYPDKTFRPNKKITKAEFSSLLGRIFYLDEIYATGEITRGDVAIALAEITQSTKAPSILNFLDTVPKTVGVALNKIDTHDLMRGFPDNTFRAENPITRAEVAVILYRLLSFPD